MPEYFASIGEAIGSAMAHNARMAADLATARHLADQAAVARPVPAGGNAEDCPRCTGTNPPYPFLCPGHPAECGPECAEGHLYAYRCALKPSPPDPAFQLHAAADKLRGLTAAADHDVDTNPYWQSELTDRPDWYANGIRNALGCPAGDLAAALTPTACAGLADWLDGASRDAVEIGPDPHALAFAEHLLGGNGDGRQQDTAGTVSDTGRTPDTSPAGQSRTPETLQANEPGQQDKTPDAEQDNVLDVLLARLLRGAILRDERALLRQHVEQLRADRDLKGDAARERADLLEETRDALEAAGEPGAHADDWPATAPGVHRLASARDRLAAEVARLRAGEEPLPAGHSPAACTPAQWIWMWNKAHAEARLLYAKGIIAAEANHIEQCNTIARVREVTDRDEPLGRFMGDEPDGYARGWAAAMDTVETALDGPPADTCRPVEVDGETIRVHGTGDLSEEGHEAVAALVRAAKRRYQAEHSPAGGQVDDSSPAPAAVVHPDAEQQANAPAEVDELPVTVEALAQLISDAEAEIDGDGASAPWADRPAEETDLCRRYARYLLQRCHITTKEA